MKKNLFALAFLFILGAVYPINVDFYYGQGCPHCASTEQLLNEIKEDYNLNINYHEIYYDAVERLEFMEEYERFSYDVSKTIRATIDANYPKFLAERLYMGI